MEYLRPSSRETQTESGILDAHIYDPGSLSENKNMPCKQSRLRWAGYVPRMEEGRSAFKILTGTPTGKKSLGRPRRIREDNIRMDLK